jgi:hypothetical protein
MIRDNSTRRVVPISFDRYPEVVLIAFKGLPRPRYGFIRANVELVRRTRIAGVLGQVFHHSGPALIGERDTEAIVHRVDRADGIGYQILVE